MPVIFTPDADRKDHEHHHLLVEALAAKDGNKAESIVRGHIQLTLKIVLDALGIQDQVLFIGASQHNIYNANNKTVTIAQAQDNTAPIMGAVLAFSWIG